MRTDPNRLARTPQVQEGEYHVSHATVFVEQLRQPQRYIVIVSESLRI